MFFLSLYIIWDSLIFTVVTLSLSQFLLWRDHQHMRFGVVHVMVSAFCSMHIDFCLLILFPNGFPLLCCGSSVAAVLQGCFYHHGSPMTTVPWRYPAVMECLLPSATFPATSSQQPFPLHISSTILKSIFPHFPLQQLLLFAKYVWAGGGSAPLMGCCFDAWWGAHNGVGANWAQ